MRCFKSTFLALLVFYLIAAPIVKAQKPETSHLVFVTEVVREIAAIEDIRDSATRDLKQDPKAPFANMIHSSTMFQLELGSQASQMRSMRLQAPFDELNTTLAELYERKIPLWQRMSEIGAAFMGGPKSGVDYDALAAEIPKIRAELDFIDQTIFQASPMIFSTLIDMKEDSKGHANHLIITKAERAELLNRINTSFGAKFASKDKNYDVSTMEVFKTGLMKGFKCSDEPWE